MTENPINPAALYDYAASKNDMDSLRPEERTFLEACAWEWERLIDHGAEEWGKQFEALGIKPGVPQAPSAKPTPAAPEKPACEHKRGSGSINTDGSGGFKCFDCPHEVKYPATRTGPEPVPMWVTEPPRCEVCGWTLAESRDKGCVAGDCSYRPTEGTEEWYRIKARRDALKAQAAPSSPAAERADEGLEEEAERLREAYTNDEGSWLEWPDCRQEPWLRVARAARALRRGGVTEEPWGIVDDLALSGKVTDTMTAGQPARSRLRNELSAAVRERDQLAAKLAEAERALCERAEQVDKLMQERDLVMARLGNFCQPGEIEDRIRILQGHAGKMERQRDEARAEAERLTKWALPWGSVEALLRSQGCDMERAASWIAARLRSAPPAVAVTDVEKAAEKINDRIHEEVADWFKEIGFKGGGEMGYWLGTVPITDILRDCTRAASVEEVAQAIMDAWEGRPGFDVRYMKPGEVRREQVFGMAHAAIRALGVREAEKNL